MAKKKTLADIITEQMGSISALARKMNKKNPETARRTIHNWVNDPESISIGNARKLARFLDVPVCDLLEVRKGKGDE